MRTKIRVDGNWYRPVPWLQGIVDGHTECEGCAFDKEGCINTKAKGDPCEDGNEFGGMIFIPATKKAMAEYVAKRLGVADDI